MDTKAVSSWIDLNKGEFSGILTRLPERKELNSKINDGLIVEFYNR